ncbi:restriction endonuclease subunit S [uncultured Fusobacterium sp.]|uniref:restriction endonuclease subunit S n=1 Tax=uncultured Fusobacterium sp. TaxID=159267 RepID=UPI00259A10A3|nr:restriction endonuclease subunit S [uncultured Fusobacterium sp.]
MAREMKDSGVEWIGEIPREWRTLPLGNCFLERIEKVSDKEWEPLSVTKKGIFKQLENVAKSDAHDSRKKVCKGDFVINSRSDRKQSCGLSDFDGSVSLINIVLKNIFYKAEYTKYLLKNDGFAEEFYRWGSGIVADLWSTKYSKMKKIILPVPSLEEQEKIANYLDKKVSDIDLIIEKTKATIEDYKKYKQSIITEAVTKGINPNVEMKDSGIKWIGEIPKHWKIFPIKYILKWKSEKNYPNEMVLSLYRDYGVIPKDSRDDNHNVTSEDTASYKFVEVGDFVINKMKAWQGSMAVSDYQGIVSPAYHVCSFKTNELNKKYFHYLLRNQLYLPEFRRLSTGLRIGQWDLGFEDFKQLPYLFPLLEEQNQIVEYIDKKISEIDTLITKKEALIAELEEYKKSLIYECVTGKKEVNENV